MSKTPKAVLSTVPAVLKFHHTGKELVFGKICVDAKKNVFIEIKLSATNIYPFAPLEQFNKVKERLSSKLKDLYFSSKLNELRQLYFFLRSANSLKENITFLKDENLTKQIKLTMFYLL